MSILSTCQWLQDTYTGTSIRESIWVFPIIETIHVLALSISVGLLLVSDLRLMGYIMKRRPVSEVYEQIKPWMFTGFAIMTVTGIFLFWCWPPSMRSLSNAAFIAKWINGTTRLFLPWKLASQAGHP